MTEEEITVKKRQIEELQAVWDNVSDTKKIMDGVLSKMEEMGEGAESTELTVRFIRHEKTEAI